MPPLSVFCSFVVPTTRPGFELGPTLESIQNLKIPTGWSIEILVVDNRAQNVPGSTDLPGGVRLIREKTRGAAFARNAGAKAARGEFLAFCDDDVILDSNWLCSVKKVFDENPWIKIISGSTIPVKLKNEPFFEYRASRHHFHTAGTGNYLFGNPRLPVVDSALFAISKSAFEWVGGFNGEIEQVEDNDFTLRLLASGFQIHALLDCPAQEVYRPDSFFSYFRRSARVGMNIGLILTRFEFGQPSGFIRKGFPLPDFKNWGEPFPWARYVNEIFLNMGYLFRKKGQPVSKSYQETKGYPLSQFMFRFSVGSKSYLLSPGAGLVWLGREVRIYFGGNYFRSLVEDEIKTLVAVASQKRDLLEQRKEILHRWISDGFFTTL